MCWLGPAVAAGTRIRVAATAEAYDGRESKLEHVRNTCQLCTSAVGGFGYEVVTLWYEYVTTQQEHEPQGDFLDDVKIC